MAQVAIQKNFSKPIIDDSLDIEIVSGRHPVIENFQSNTKEFTANDFSINSSQKIWVITG